MLEQVVEVYTTFLHVQDTRKMFWELQNDLWILLNHYLIEEKNSFFIIKMNFLIEISDRSGTFKITVSTPILVIQVPLNLSTPSGIHFQTL